MPILNPPPTEVPSALATNDEVRAYISTLNTAVYQMWVVLNNLVNEPQNGYTDFANLTETRTLDVSSTNLTEVANVLGTLAKDLKDKDLIGE